MAATLTTLDSLLKNVYLPGLPDYVNKYRPLLARIERITDKKNFRGRKFIFAAKLSNTQSTGWLNEGDTLPTGGNAVPINMELTMKYHYAVARISAQALDASMADDAAFQRVQKLELDSARDQIRDDIAMNAVYGTGAGDLGQVSSYTSASLTMTSQPTVGALGTRLLRAGQYLSSYSATSGGSQGADHKQVSAIASTTVATVPTSAGFNSSDYVFRSTGAGVDPRNKAMMGLGGLIDDGTRVGTIQTLSRTTYPQLKALLLGNSGTLRAISEDLLDQLCTEARQNGGGGNPTAMYSPLPIQRRISAILRQDRMFDGTQAVELKGGYSGVTWRFPGGSCPWFDDNNARPNEVMALKEDDLFAAEEVPTTIVNDDGSMWRFTDRTDTVECWFRTWQNLGAYQFNNSAVLRDISHTA